VSKDIDTVTTVIIATIQHQVSHIAKHMEIKKSCKKRSNIKTALIKNRKWLQQ
jgi:hypothetical protein